MSEAYVARPQNRAMALERLQKVKLPKDELGQYKHDDAVKYTELVKRELTGMYNMLDPQHGMAKLAEKAENKINKIKSTDAVTASDILRESKQKAARESQTLNAVVTPEITTRAEAQEEADRRNQYCQAVIGVKEGVTEAFIEAVGSDATDAVLKDADGSSDKSIDDYKIHELIDAIISGANRPKAPDVLAQFIDVANFAFDFRKKIITNVETLKAKANRVQSYGIKIDTAVIVLTIFANIERAVTHEWGREFRPAMQVIRAKYDYDYQHDDTSLADILAQLAAADSVRSIKEAPEPETGAAHAVDQLTLLQQMMMQQNDYKEDEEAMAVHSDSESSADTKRSNRRGAKKTTRRGTSRGRSQSRRRKMEKNKCKHCKKFKKRIRVQHDENRCFFNKAYKGWRPRDICDELEIKFKPRYKFSSDLGGYPSDSGSDSGSE